MAQENKNYGDYRDATPRTMKIVFGIFMILIYIGMGVLLLTGFFDAVITYSWIRIVLAVAFIIYGIWRAYRQFSNRY